MESVTALLLLLLLPPQRRSRCMGYPFARKLFGFLKLAVSVQTDSLQR